MRGQPLFEKVVELCGVSAVLAPGLVRRALLDGKVAVPDATPADYRAALPRLVARLRAYLPEDEAQRRSRRISAMLTNLDAPSGETTLPPVSVFEDDEPTLMGRRFTAHELEVARGGEEPAVRQARGAVHTPAALARTVEGAEKDDRPSRPDATEPAQRKLKR